MTNSKWNLSHAKNVMDYLKHFTTLSTGSILLLTALLEKLIKLPKSTFLITTAIILFLISIISAMTAYTILIFDSNGGLEKEWPKTIGGLAFVLTWVGFTLGIILICTFTIINFNY